MQTAPFNSSDCMSTTKDGRLNQKEQLFLAEKSSIITKDIPQKHTKW